MPPRSAAHYRGGVPTVYDPDGRAWSVRRRISPRTPRDASVFDWVDLFGATPLTDERADERTDGRPDERPDRLLSLGLLTAAIVAVVALASPQLLARAAPLIALLLLAAIGVLGRPLLGVPTIIEAWSGPERESSRHIAVRARGWGAGPRAERDVCAALRDGYDFR